MLWNALSDKIKSCQTLHIFKKKIKAIFVIRVVSFLFDLNFRSATFCKLHFSESVNVYVYFLI